MTTADTAQVIALADDLVTACKASVHASFRAHESKINSSADLNRAVRAYSEQVARVLTQFGLDRRTAAEQAVEIVFAVAREVGHTINAC